MIDVTRCSSYHARQCDVRSCLEHRKFEVQKIRRALEMSAYRECLELRLAEGVDEGPYLGTLECRCYYIMGNTHSCK
jgi:hypothetical protein